jgi:hypothetical protein
MLPKQWRRYTRACQGKCPGKKASALVAALPEICGHQFSSFRNNTPAKYIKVSINPSSANRKSTASLPLHSSKNPFTLRYDFTHFSTAC